LSGVDGLKDDLRAAIGSSAAGRDPEAPASDRRVIIWVVDIAGGLIGDKFDDVEGSER
jgi:hypothetical protein